MKKALICASSMVVLQLLCEVAMTFSFWKHDISDINEFPFDLFVGVFSFWGLAIFFISIFYRCTSSLFKHDIFERKFVSDVFFCLKMRVLFMISAVGIYFAVRILNNPKIYDFPENMIQTNRRIIMNDSIRFFIHPATFWVTYLPLIVIFGIYIWKSKTKQSAKISS